MKKINDHSADRLNEAQVKLALGDWLKDCGFEVFDERKNKERPHWEIFEVSNINRGKCPDLIVKGNLQAAKTMMRGVYVTVEIKRGYKHHDVLDGFDAVLEYFSDYLWGAEYRIQGQSIEIASFVFATLFSKEGYLFQEEGKLGTEMVKKPWDAYPLTFTISRLLWRQKDNMVKRLRVLSGIPKVEKKIKRNLCPDRAIPEVGILTRNPSDKNRVRLMLSKHPYNWKFEAVQGKI